MKVFGKRIRELRLEQQLSQRDLAAIIEIDFTYLSKIENGKVAPPSELVIYKLAEALDADSETLLTLAVKFSTEDLLEAVERNPDVGILFRKLQSKDLTNEQIKQMLNIVIEDEVANSGEDN